MNFDKLNTNKVEKQSGVKKWFKKNAALAGVVGLGYLGSLNNSQAQEQQQSPEGSKTNITNVEVGRKDTNSNQKVENVEQAMEESLSIVASLNGTSSEIVKEMLKDVLAKEFPSGIPVSIGGQKVQLVFNLRIEDREKSEYGTVNAGATLRWEVKDIKGSIVKRGAAVDVIGPAAFNANSARTKAVTSALEKISPEIKNLFEVKA